MFLDQNRYLLLIMVGFAMLFSGCASTSGSIDLEQEVDTDLPAREDFLSVFSEFLQAQKDCRFPANLMERVLPSEKVGQDLKERDMGPCLGEIERFELIVDDLPALEMAGAGLIVESKKGRRSSEFFIPIYYRNGKWYFSRPQVFLGSLHPSE